MRACSFNVRHGRPTGRRGPDHGLLVASIRALDVDVIGLQEVDRGTRRVGGVDQPALIGSGTGLDVRFGRAIDFDGGGYGVLIAVRGVILSSEVLRLSGSGEPRIALLARVRTATDGHEWAVACTHLTTAVTEVPTQLREVLAGLSLVAGERPAVLMGDLNAGPDVTAPVLDELGWAAAPTGATHPSDRPVRSIDRVVYRGAEVGSCGVVDLRAGMPGEGRSRSGGVLSDHRPVFAQLSGVDIAGGSPYPADGTSR